MQSAKDHMFCSDFPDKLRAPGGTCESAGVTSAWFSDRHRSSWFLQKMTEYKTRAYKGSEDVATVGLWHTETSDSDELREAYSCFRKWCPKRKRATQKIK